jgi:hypothetical protein
LCGGSKPFASVRLSIFWKISQEHGSRPIFGVLNQFFDVISKKASKKYLDVDILRKTVQKKTKNKKNHVKNIFFGSFIKNGE